MKRSAFSLVEVLMVLTIMAVLAAILTPAFGAAKQRARTEIKTQQLRQLSAATLIYMNENESQLPPTDITGGIEWHRIVLNGASKAKAAQLLNPDKPDDTSVFPSLQSIGYSLNQCLLPPKFGGSQPRIDYNPYLIVQAAELKHKGLARVFTLTFELPCHDRVYGELQGMEPASGRYLGDSDNSGSVAARYDGSVKWAPFGLFKSRGCACSFPGDEPETPFQTYPR